MKIQEAKENVVKNFRANYTTFNNPSIHDIEIFLLNTMEQIVQISKQEFKDAILSKLKNYEGRYGCENTKHEIITFIKNHK